MNETNKVKIENKFFDLISFFVSFFITIFKSLFLFFGNKNKIKSSFFDFFDFIFRIWPRYFWIKPSLYKGGRFLKDLIDFIFYKNNKNEK